MVVKRFAPASLPFHHAGARPGVGESPVKHAILEQIFENALKSPGKSLAPSAWRETPDAVEYLPNSDGGEGESLSDNGVEKRRDPGLRFPPHHFRYDIGVEEIGEGFSHLSFPLVRSSG